MASDGVKEIEDKYRWFMVEFDPFLENGTMPSLFNRQFYDKIGSRVWLTDYFNNEIEVKVLKRDGKVHFTDGWHQVGRVYNLIEGGYLKVFLNTPYEIVIDTVLHRWMVEVKYLEHPQCLPLGPPSSVTEIEDDDVGLDGDAVESDVEGENVEVAEDEGNDDHSDSDGVSSEMDSDSAYYVLTEKKLSRTDVTSGSLCLPATFCFRGLVRGTSNCEIVDEDGNKWSAKLRWSHRYRNECCLTSGWGAYARAKNYREGMHVNISLSKSYPSMIYIIRV